MKSQLRGKTESTSIDVRPSSSETTKFFCSSGFIEQILFGKISATRVTVRKYCTDSDGT